MTKKATEMMDERWPGLREAAGTKKLAPSVLVCVPGKSRSFLQEAAREKPGNKSVDGRV